MAKERAIYVALLVAGIGSIIVYVCVNYLM